MLERKKSISDLVRYVLIRKNQMNTGVRGFFGVLDMLNYVQYDKWTLDFKQGKDSFAIMLAYQACWVIACKPIIEQP